MQNPSPRRPRSRGRHRAVSHRLPYSTGLSPNESAAESTRHSNLSKRTNCSSKGRQPTRPRGITSVARSRFPATGLRTPRLLLLTRQAQPRACFGDEEVASALTGGRPLCHEQGCGARARIRGAPRPLRQFAVSRSRAPRPRPRASSELRGCAARGGRGCARSPGSGAAPQRSAASSGHAPAGARLRTGGA